MYVYIIYFIYIMKGSIFYISSHDPSTLTFKNITQKNTGNVRFMREGGLIMR